MYTGKLDSLCYIEIIVAKFLDIDERVRAAACLVIGALDMDVLIGHLDMLVLEQLGQRCRDKKVRLND
jgi:hypothetical protein